jgi:hypothetical protein
VNQHRLSGQRKISKEWRLVFSDRASGVFNTDKAKAMDKVLMLSLNGFNSANKIERFYTSLISLAGVVEKRKQAKMALNAFALPLPVYVN